MVKERGSEAAGPVLHVFQTQRVRWFSRYLRLFKLYANCAATSNDDGSEATNVFIYERIAKLEAVAGTSGDFLLEVVQGEAGEEGGADESFFSSRSSHSKSYVYESPSRARLLCHLLERIASAAPTSRLVAGRTEFKSSMRVKRSGMRSECHLTVWPFGFVESDPYSSPSGRVVRVYYFYNMRKISAAVPGHVHFEYAGRIKLFQLATQDSGATRDSPNPSASASTSLSGVLLVAEAKAAVSSLGLACGDVFEDADSAGAATTLQEVVSRRHAAVAAATQAGSVSTFEVNKVTQRCLRPVPRQIHVNEDSIVEKDGSGFVVTGCHRIASLFRVVRSTSSSRELSIEYDDGSACTYTSASRDTLLALLLDLSWATGNFRVTIADAPSDGVRMIPRSVDVEEVATAVSFLQLHETVLGLDSSVEARLLKRLSLLGNGEHRRDVVDACVAINANISYPGIAPSTDSHVVRACLSLLLRCLNAEMLDNATPAIVALLQTLHKIIPCLHGYKAFVEVAEIDVRLLLRQLLQMGDPYVGYWSLQVLLGLCRCPLAPRNAQQEFVNKQVLLTEDMVAALMDLVSSGAPASGETEVGNDEAGGEPQQQQQQYERLQAFLPNPLAAMAAAAILESIVSSKKDTTSPELMSRVLDVLAERCEVLVHMLRSTSFLIMENAAILMFVLLKQRPGAGQALKEMALSEGLALKHFFNGVFSSSSSQRFISRFLAATWLCGKEDNDPGRALLRRMLPSGLIEFLKHAPMSEAHRASLDELEETFYCGIYGAASASSGMDIQMRMSHRISAVLKERRRPEQQHPFLLDSGSAEEGLTNLDGDAAPPSQSPIGIIKSAADMSAKGSQHWHNHGRPATFDNYRVMFFMMTQDHNMPDLIWNEQTRLELRSSLEQEIKSFEQEQRLRGAHEVAWNFQQFNVSYPSLRDDMQVGPVYIRHFLQAEDDFLRAIENPSHLELFERLFRRVLVNVVRSPRVSILCVKCLCRLYRVCGDLIGEFDDMLLAVRMLEQAADMELQHCLLDLLECLCADDANLLQLLDGDFVDVMLRFVSLGHLNPDQIGNLLARHTATTLLLKDESAGQRMPRRDLLSQAHVPASAAVSAEEEAEERRLKKSVWVPHDEACPRVWLVAPAGVNPPPANLQQGPFHVTELLDRCESGQLDKTWLLAPSASDECDAESFDALVDTGRWRPLGDYFQLRMQMLFPGKVMYGPAEVALRCLAVLSRIASVHRAQDCRGLPFYPVPASKRVMSEPAHLRVVAQLLLSNDLRVVDAAAELLCALVEANAAANSKLYLTGAFFFACKYSGNNFLPLAELLRATHLQQSYHDGGASMARELNPGARSILASILPTALITVLVNYGAERFASVFTGSVDTPEVIWNPELRQQLVEMIDQHIGNFAARLRQHTLSRYDYCPIPRVRFPALDREIYVHEFYIRNLCDEAKFPDWPVGSPLTLLRDAIERWRMEMAKGVVGSAVGDSRMCLGLADGARDADLRQAYKRLARQYHPDRNPGGRDMFEKVQAAYELLSSLDLRHNETSLDNVLLLVRVQSLIYRRHADEVADQKYPVYRLLLSVYKLPNPSSLAGAGPGPGPGASGEMDLAVEVTRLLHLTCSVSPLNTRELVRAGGIAPLYEAMSLALDHLPPCVDMLALSVKAFKSISATEAGRGAIVELCPAFATDMRSLLLLDQTLPLVAEDCIAIMANCAADARLQSALACAGVVWMLVPLLLAYDATLQHDEYSASDAQRAVYNQGASNMHAILAARALGRLGGYMQGDQASPPNAAVTSALDRLLTPQLARLLRNALPWELLKTLNENVETTTRIWNVRMRSELLQLVGSVNDTRPPGPRDDDLAPAEGFLFSALEAEPCVGGVYIRIFNRSGGDCSEIESPTDFCLSLLAFLASHAIDEEAPAQHRREYLDGCIEALRLLVDTHDDVADDVARAPLGPEIIFGLVERHAPSSETFHLAARLLSVLVVSREFVSAVLAREAPGQVWKVLQFICTTEGPATPYVWTAAEHIVSHPDGIEALLAAGGVMRILCCLFAVPGYVHSYQVRLASVILLAKFLSHPSRGSDAAATLSRFLPEPLVLLLRGKTGTACLRLLDDLCETPELVWTSEMRLELRGALVSLLAATTSFREVPFRADFRVRFRALASELSIGGVYLKLFLRQPSFRLSNPVLFLEKVVERWESCFKMHIASSSSAAADFSETRLAAEADDSLGLLTTAICAVARSEPSVVDHLQQWGFPQALAEHLHQALAANFGARGVGCVVDILHHLVGRAEVVNALAHAPVDIILQLTYALDTAEGRPLPAEAGSIVELLRRIFQSRMASALGQLVTMALAAGLPQVLLERVIAAGPEDLVRVSDASNLKIHAIETIKAIMVVDEIASAALQDTLDRHPAWSDYRDQGHHLYLTSSSALHFDSLVIVDHDKRNALLLADEPFQERRRASASVEARAVAPPRERASLSSYIAERGARVSFSSMSMASTPSSSPSPPPSPSPTEEEGSGAEGAEGAEGASDAPSSPACPVAQPAEGASPETEPQREQREQRAGHVRSETPLSPSRRVSQGEGGAPTVQLAPPPPEPPLAAPAPAPATTSVSTPTPVPAPVPAPVPTHAPAAAKASVRAVAVAVARPPAPEQAPETERDAAAAPPVLARQSLPLAPAASASASAPLSGANRASVLPGGPGQRSVPRDSLLSPFVAAGVHAAPPAATTAPASAPNRGPLRRTLLACIVKGAEGIGLDLVKGANDGTFVQKFKVTKGPNPAALCQPPIKVGDAIVAVNGLAGTDFGEVVKAIRAVPAGGTVEILLERNV